MGDSGGTRVGDPASAAAATSANNSTRAGPRSAGAAGANRPTGTSNNGSRSRGSTGGGNSGNGVLPMPVELECDTVNNRFSDSACECCDSGLLTRHRCRVEDPNSRYFYRESQGGPVTLICGKAFCVQCQLRWNSEDRVKCGDCLHLEIDEKGLNSRLQQRLKTSAMKGDSKKNSTTMMPIPSSKISVCR